MSKRNRKTIIVKEMIIGEGAPKICVPLVGSSFAHLIEEANYLKTVDLDLVEWRVDFFEHVEQIAKVKEVLREIRAILPQTPLVFTFRSAKEGGEKEVSTDFYFELNKA